MAAYDLAYPVPLASASSPVWGDLRVLFPGQRPRFVEAGSVLWLRVGDRFVRSYEVAAVEHWDRRRSDVDGAERGPGAAVVLVAGSGRRRNRPLSRVGDPDGSAGTWSRGIRYLTPGAGSFVHPSASTRRRVARAASAPRTVPLERADAEEVTVVTDAAVRSAQRREQRLVRRYRSWLRATAAILSVTCCLVLAACWSLTATTPVDLS